MRISRPAVTRTQSLPWRTGQLWPMPPATIRRASHYETDFGPFGDEVPDGKSAHQDGPYSFFGCGTIRMYGRGDFHPPGYTFLASSSDTDPAMMTSSPCFQFTGVATLCFAVNWSESITRSTSSKLRPVVIGYAIISLTFLSGPMT